MAYPRATIPMQAIPLACDPSANNKREFSWEELHCEFEQLQAQIQKDLRLAMRYQTEQLSDLLGISSTSTVMQKGLQGNVGWKNASAPSTGKTSRMNDLPPQALFGQVDNGVETRGPVDPPDMVHDHPFSPPEPPAILDCLSTDRVTEIESSSRDTVEFGRFVRGAFQEQDRRKDKLMQKLSWVTSLTDKSKVPDSKPLDVGLTKQSRWRARTEKVLDIFVTVIIVLNGILIGAQTQYQSENLGGRVPLVYTVSEQLFCAIFMTEIAARIYKNRLNFWYGKDWYWNWFDFALVAMQLVEVIGMYAAGHEFSAEDRDVSSPGSNLSFFRLLRIVRCCRVFRLVRLVRFLQELLTISCSIMNSIRSLFWTMIFMLLMMYITGIFFTQLAIGTRIEYRDAHDEDTIAIDYWFGSLFRVMLTLYQAVMGGVDWDAVVSPLMNKITPFIAPFFGMYIAFAVLAVMNVITGMFVDSALKSAGRQNDKDFAAMARNLFAPVVEEGYISAEDFDLYISEPHFLAYMATIGIGALDAKLMFRIVDRNCQGQLALEELLQGMIRLRAPAKFMDISLLMHESERQVRIWQKWTDSVDTTLTRMLCHMSSIETDMKLKEPASMAPTLNKVPRYSS